MYKRQVLLIGVSYLIGQLTAGQDVKIIKDLGLAAISVFGLLMAVFIGVGLVWKEVERRSIYSLLAKPVRRGEVVAGKYAGLALTLLVNMAAMAAAYFAVLAYMGGADPRLLVAIVLIAAELLLVTAVALFFSTFSTPFLSTVLTLGLWVIGRFNSGLRDFGVVTESAAASWLTRGIYYVFPNFSAFDVKLQAVHGLPVPAAYVATTLAYAGVYVALLLAGAIAIFSRRDFK